MKEDNGVVEQARDAKRETEIRQWEEKIDIAILQAENNHLNPSIDDVIEELINANIIENASKVDKETGIITTKDPSYEISDKLSDYIDKPLLSGEVVVGEKVTGENKDYSNKGTAKIPEGFAIVPGLDDVSKGLVISDVENDTGDVGNQFVWIPVDKETLCVGGTDKEIAEIDSIIADVTTDLDTIDKEGETDTVGMTILYRGVLYDFSSGTSKKIEYSSTGNREPDVVTYSGNSYDNNTEYLNIINNILKDIKVEPNFTELNNANDLKEYLQREYNDIIESIKANGGFYIGRYESSLSSSNSTTAGATGTIQSKRNVLPAGANNTETTNMWYGLYAKQKEFASTLEGTAVKSAMIYGSMYDAVMNWALSDENEKDKVTANSTERGSKQPTGTLESDKIKNIYDLGNNLYEWTAEAAYTSSRVSRGGNYNTTISPSVRHSYFNPVSTGSSYGSRLLLYL